MGCFHTSSPANIAVMPESQLHPETSHLLSSHPQERVLPLPSNPQVQSMPNDPQVPSMPNDPQGQPPQLSKPQQAKPSASQKKISQQIMEGFDISKLMKEKLDNVAHTPDQLESIVNELVKTIIKLQTCQTMEEKNSIALLLKEIDQEHLYYYKAVEKLKSKIKGEVKPESLSRIYHEIANFKKKQKVNSEQENELRIKQVTTNEYDQLSEQQVDQVVGYESVSQKILELGTKINYKFSSIEKDSNGIINLLAQTSSHYQKDIQGLKYDLNPQEYKKVAQISRDACNHHDSGVVLLFIYFVRACRNLEQSKESVKEIEKKLDETIQWISKEYPPGQGLEASKKHLEGALKNLQQEDKFAHQPSKLNNTEDKQAQLERIILHNASIAKRNRDNFEELIRQACFKLAIQTKVGLKLNPDSPNKKAMIRIKEKMLFGKTEKLDKKAKETIQETIESEDSEYKRAIDRILKEKEEVTFKISDMVRGKCVFLEVEDIIQTVNQIKEFVKNDPKGRYRITEIESRFTNPQPISDVTLKIAINEEVVSELQLTVQANAAAYNFAHKVYELARTKVFSKVKISHNYFQEFAGDFKVQTSKALDISKREAQRNGSNQKYCTISKQTATIRQLVDLSSLQTPKSYEQVMIKSIIEQNKKLTSSSVSINKKLQNLMLALFSKQMGSWKEELGKEINLVLESEQYPPLLKSTLLFYFLNSLNISKEVIQMVHFEPTYRVIAEQLGFQERFQIMKGKDYVKIYLQQEFAIKNPFAYQSSTARLFYKALQTQKITLKKFDMYNPSFLIVEEYIKGVVMEQNSPEEINFISQLVHSFFNVRGKALQVRSQFDHYYTYLMSKLELQPRLVPDLAGCSSKFLKVQTLLEKQKNAEAQNILNQILLIFKQNEEIEQELQCQLLLAECKANTYDLNKFREHYAKNVVKKAEALGIELKGVAVANSEWRIYQKLWKKDMNTEDKQYVLKTHFNKAMTESSRNQGEAWLIKAVTAKQENDHLSLQQCILENNTVNYINISYYYGINGKESTMQHLKSCRWPKLTTFICIMRHIGVKGCQHLSKVSWKNLSSLDLFQNIIGAEGCEYLSKADWKNLSYLNLQQNQIGAQGCKHLSKADWRNLSILNLTWNNLGQEGCQHLSNADWPNISSLNLRANGIDSVGCQYLSQAKWKKLSSLQLRGNNIGDKGCYFLSKADWKNLSSLSLYENGIGAIGCQHLVNAKWANLKYLDVSWNSIGNEGCQHLIKGVWKNLSKLELAKNGIDAKGCLQLGKAEWNILSYLRLQSNNIDKSQHPQLKQLILKMSPNVQIAML